MLRKRVIRTTRQAKTAHPRWWSSIGWTLNQISRIDNSLTISSPYNTGSLIIEDYDCREWWSLIWKKSTETVQSQGQVYLCNFDLWRAFWLMDVPEDDLTDDERKFIAAYDASDVSLGKFIRYNGFTAIPGPASMQDDTFPEWLSLCITEEIRMAVRDLYNSRPK